MRHLVRLSAVALVAALCAPGCGADDDPGAIDAGNATADGGGGGGTVDGGGGGTVDGGGGGTVDAAQANGEPASLMGITAAHNVVRAEVGVGPMTWDPALAAIAQAWADACTDNTAPAGLIDHNAGRSDNYPGYVGENIYGSSGTATGQGAVNSWAAEKQFYTHSTNSCQAGKTCGHYTQIVWRDSVKLGCGISSCSSLTYRNSIVCNYAPGGNYGGQSPY